MPDKKQPICKILTVDDQMGIDSFFYEFFSARNYEVLSATSGEEALKIVRKENPRIVLLDINMKGMDGIEALKKIKEYNKDIIVIMVSGVKDDEDNQASSRVYRGDIGVNYGLGNHSIEVAVGIADVTFKLKPPSSSIPEIVSAFNNEESEKALFANVRIFYDMPQLGGKLVPVFKYADSKVNVYSENILEGGLGLNKDIEKGIFYAGISGQSRYVEDASEQMDWARVEDSVFTTDTTNNSARVSFGIEKNIVWKWFVVRVGGQKVVTQQRVVKHFQNGTRTRTTEKWVTNVDDDSSILDVIGFGVGFNFGNKLRVDGTINENFPYQNPFGYLGDVGKRLATRVSATYSF